jgi:hypothetical protein
MDGLSLGDHDKAAERVYRFSLRTSIDDQRNLVDHLVALIEVDSEGNTQHIASSLLEAFGRIDPPPMSIADRLSKSNEFTARSCAANLMWDRALHSPAEVSLGVLGRLADPAYEDWYVYSPALAAAKELLLRRHSTRVLFDLLSRSEDPDVRHTVVSALIDVARVDPCAVPRDLAERLGRDENQHVSLMSEQLLGLLDAQPAPAFSTLVGHFGL